jgi:hypothetical protein
MIYITSSVFLSNALPWRANPYSEAYCYPARRIRRGYIHRAAEKESVLGKWASDVFDSRKLGFQQTFRSSLLPDIVEV